MSLSSTQPAWLSLLEVAELLGVNPRTVRRRISDGTIPAVRVGRLIRIPATAVQTVGTPIGGKR